MFIGVEIARRERKCSWCPTTIAPGAGCLMISDFGRTRKQICEECVRKAYLIVSKRTEFPFTQKTPHPDLLDKL
jgi:hypothetical protein